MRHDIAVYALQGMSYFGTFASRLLGCRYYEQIPLDRDFDKVLVVGMYDSPMFSTTLKHTQKAKQRIIMWCGSDVQFCPHDAGLVLPEATHLCDSENLKQELWERGIDATVCPWPTANNFDVTPYPELPTIAFYQGNQPEKYGASLVTAALEVIQNDKSDFGYLAYWAGEYTAEQMKDVVARSTVYVRLTEHDGGAMSAKEFLQAGRRVICSQDVKYAKRIAHDDLVGLIAALRKALKETEPDYEAAAYWKAQNSVERWKQQVGEWL